MKSRRESGSVALPRTFEHYPVKADTGSPVDGSVQHPIHQPTLTKAAQDEITLV